MGPGVSNVTIGGLPAAVVGDMHLCAIIPTPATPHPTTTAFPSGSAKVMVGGRPLLRVGDLAACGAAIAVGASNVIAG